MSPLQKIAMGLVIVVGAAYFPADPDPAWQRYDALPDPVGWAMVLLGTIALARANDAFGSTRWAALVAGLVSVPLWFPQVQHRLDPSGEWAASLPQIAFCLLLARQVGVEAAERTPPDDYAAKRFGLLVTAFAVLAVLPVLVFGGGVDALTEPTAVISMVVNVALVYFLFRVHRREWLGGPGPVEVPARTAGRNAEGRPPSS